MNNAIYPCLWFDGQAREAMIFYCSVFEQSEILEDTPMVVRAQLGGQLFMGLNGGPQFRPNASISFMAICDDPAEAERYWDALSQGGNVLMPLDSYAWSDKYGWVEDRFGLSWQIYLSSEGAAAQKIVPTLMYCGVQQGKAEEAINFYTALFKNAGIKNVLKYSNGPFAGQVQHAQIVLDGYTLMAMDSGVPQSFSFTEGISLVLECESQDDIDHYWDAFTKDGSESMCGWCRDAFGVSWQVIPAALAGMMKEPGRAKKVMDELMKMRKLDIARLQNA